MYKVKSGGAVVGYSDTVVYIKLHESGTYMPCEPEEAGGFCVKVAVDYEVEGETETRAEDFVYQLKEDGLLGYEPIGSVESVSGPLLLAEADSVLEILLGGTEV